MALAIHYDRLIQAGEIRDRAEIACLGQVNRDRVTQNMTLLPLAPDLKEDLLLLPWTRHGRDPIP